MCKSQLIIAYAHFLSGPPGGRTLPLTTTRLSDLAGGIYGPHASWASTGANALRNSVRAASAAARGETEAEVLEYFQYHSDRDSHPYTVRLGKLYYLGSVYPIQGGSARGPGISAGAEGVGEIPQSFTKAREYFMRVARTFWPKDFDQNGVEIGKRKMTKEMEDGLRDPAMVAAAFLGRMALRGEGQKVNYKLARLWYQRASALVGFAI
jgi:SEL1 protein